MAKNDKGDRKDDKPAAKYGGSGATDPSVLDRIKELLAQGAEAVTSGGLTGNAKAALASRDKRIKDATK